MRGDRHSHMLCTCVDGGETLPTAPLAPSLLSDSHTLVVPASGQCVLLCFVLPCYLRTPI